MGAVARPPAPEARHRRSRRPPRRAHHAARRRPDPPSRSAMRPPAIDAMAMAAARCPIPRDSTIWPRRRAGYIAPHRRRWNGPPNDRLIQNTRPAPIITGGVGSTNSATSDAAPTARTSARCLVERGPTRPANAPRRFATNGWRRGRPGRSDLRRLDARSFWQQDTTRGPGSRSSRLRPVRSRARSCPTSRRYGLGRTA